METKDIVYWNTLIKEGKIKKWKKMIESSGSIVISMDSTITPELYIEWLKNDLVRFIQEFRKEIKLEITDKIEFNFYWIDTEKIKERFIKDIEENVQGKLNEEVKWNWKWIELWWEDIWLIICKT